MQVSSPSYSYLQNLFHIYEDVLREKQFFHRFYLNFMTDVEGELKSVILKIFGYHSCHPHMAKLYRKTPFVCNYYCRQKIISYNSSALIQGEAQFSE